MNEVLAVHAQHDEDLQAAAKAFASPGGFGLGAGRTGAGGASNQGGAGGGGAGGWVHLSDVSLEREREKRFGDGATPGKRVMANMLYVRVEEEPARFWEDCMVSLPSQVGIEYTREC